MESNELLVSAESSGVSFKVALKSFYCGFGGQVQVTPILNQGTEEEKELPTTQTSVNLSANGEFWESGKFEEFLLANPEFTSLLTKALAEAAQPYQQ